MILKLLKKLLFILMFTSCSKSTEDKSKYINLLDKETLNKFPETILIKHDDYHARHIGKTSDGRQFFLTHAFESQSSDGPRSIWLVLYYFSNDGKLLDLKIVDLDEKQDSEAKREELLKTIPNATFGDIKIAPFKISYKKIHFGLFPYDFDDDEEFKSLQVQPGDFMSFGPPWNGDYDT